MNESIAPQGYALPIEDRRKDHPSAYPREPTLWTSVKSKLEYSCVTDVTEESTTGIDPLSWIEDSVPTEGSPISESPLIMFPNPERLLFDVAELSLADDELVRRLVSGGSVLYLRRDSSGNLRVGMRPFSDVLKDALDSAVEEAWTDISS